MKYVSLFSGIEAASVAWKPLGWECVAVSEIDPFPCAVLKHHYPNVPNLGSVTDITKEQLDDLKEKAGTIDLVVGGSPCQSFSVAGKRLGLEDARGNLMFEYCRIVGAIRPKWFIWENVPGALSSSGGQDFNCLLEEMAKFGYSLAWRVLDAQYFGVPQRRRRLFLVGCLGDDFGPFKVLFERESSGWDLTPSTEEGKDHSTETENSIGEHGEHGQDRRDGRDGIVVYRKSRRAQSSDDYETWVEADVSNTINCFDVGDTRTTHAIIEPVTMLESNQPHAMATETNISYTLTAAMGLGGGHVPMIVDQGYYENHPPMAVDTECFTQNTREEVRLIGGDGKTTGCLSANSGAHQTNYLAEYYENHPQDSRVNGPYDVANSVVAKYGTGGGNVPFIVEQSYDLYDDKVGSLLARDSKGIGNTYVEQNKVIIEQHHTIQHDMDFELGGTLTARDYKGISSDDFPVDAQKLVLERHIEPISIQGNLIGRNENAGPAGIGYSDTGIMYTLTGTDIHAVQVDEVNPILVESKVRRLTPIECERLQGFPDNWTEIEWNGKEAKECPISPRYKALGNSMAVPVMQWLGLGIMYAEGMEKPTTGLFQVKKKSMN